MDDDVFVFTGVPDTVVLVLLHDAVAYTARDEQYVMPVPTPVTVLTQPHTAFVFSGTI